MASFQAKNRLEKGGERDKMKIIVAFRSYPTGNTKLQKKKKKYKNTIVASFPAKIGWKRQRNRENKKCRSVSFPPNAKQKIPKKQQKNSEN